MADINAKPEQGVSAEAAEAERPRTPQRSIAEGLRKIISEFGAVFGLRLFARSATREGQHDAQIFGFAKAAREAGVAHGDGPDNLAAYQAGEESALKGESLKEAA